MTTPTWVVVVSEAAREDIRKIRRWSVQHFGTGRGTAYVRALADVIQRLADGPAAASLRQRPDLPAGILLLRAPPSGQRGQHVVLLRLDARADRPSVAVLRVLHVRMDLPSRLAEAKLAKPAPRR